jgi:glycosyltransferase involved in cell wall biosynthesis
MILSILTPAVPSRIAQLGKLCDHIGAQIGDLRVEHLVLLDNKRRSVGEKRDALLRAARGQYVAFVDDDDWVSNDYVREICEAAAKEPSVITFLQGANVNGKVAFVEFKLGNPNDPFTGSAVGAGNIHSIPRVRRNAWHVCAWRRALAVQSSFPATNYGEDWAFARPLTELVGLREIHIPLVLHFYRHDERTTEAPPPMTDPRQSVAAGQDS